MADNELSGKVKAWVESRIGGNAITRKPGHPHARDDKCFVLVDEALQGAGAKTARDFAPDGRIGPNDNYVWGDPVELDKIQPGDVLQFRNHKVVVRADVQNENGMWREQSTSGPYVRPHHCAIVVEVKADGTVVVAEQNVKPHADKVSRNEIARLEAGEETRRVSREQRLVITVDHHAVAAVGDPALTKAVTVAHPIRRVGDDHIGRRNVLRVEPLPTIGVTTKRRTPERRTARAPALTAQFATSCRAPLSLVQCGIPVPCEVPPCHACSRAVRRSRALRSSAVRRSP